MNLIAKDHPIEPVREAHSLPCRRASVSVILHDELSEPINRLAIMMQSGTLIRPPRRRRAWVLLFSFSACLVVLLYDHRCQVTQRPVGVK